MSQIGARARPIDWRELTSGARAYTADLALPGMLHARVLRSPHPHARIVELDVEAARACPGVHAVITAADLPSGARYIHEGAADRPPLADGVVRFIGQEVVAVAAETVAQADAALRAVRLRYQVLPAPLDLNAAQAPGAARLHERTAGDANVSVRFDRRWGDPDAGAAASSRSVAGDFWYPAQAHVCMEPGVALAEWRDGLLHLWTSTAAPFYVVKEVSHVLGLEREQVVCHEVGIGGSFGARTKVCDYEALAGLLAIKAGRPVRLLLTREEEFATTKSRHGFAVSLRLHGDDAHRLRAMQADIRVDNGAYNHSGASVTSAGLKGLGMQYEPDGVAATARLIDTAKRPGGQFRGYGTTQTSFALECLVDELAEASGADPVAYRIANANRPGTVTLVGARLGTSRLAQCLAVAGDAIGWTAAKADAVGVGIAAGVHVSGSYAEAGSNRSDGAIDLFADGRVCVRFGGGDAGTGQKTILAQIVAEELGVPLDRVSVQSMDSQTTPFDMGAWSSRGTHYTGHAARQTGQAAAAGLRDLRATHGDLPLGELVARAAPNSGVLTFETSYVEPSVEKADPVTGKGNISASYNFAAHAARVRVDRRTGAILLLDYVAAHDVGVALNPTLVEGQIVGGTAMGLGVALGEEVITEQGRMINGAFLNYAVPRAADLPLIRPIIVGGSDPAGPHGAKGVGETGVNPPAAAVANAIFDAIGARLRSPPFTPDKVMAALGLKKRDFHLWRRPGRWWIAVTRWAYPRGLFRVLHTMAVARYRPGAPAPVEAVTRPTTLDALVADVAAGAAPLGGGTDLHLRRRLALPVPATLASVAGVEALGGAIQEADGGWRLGAGVTLTALSGAIEQAAPAIAEAIAQIASPQIRAVATLGGSLLQANRCWFLRSGFDCYKRRGGVAPCYAIEGDHRFYHAVIDGHRCQSVTPSDLAGVLSALDAEAMVRGPAGERLIAMAHFYKGPGESVMAPGEVLVAVRLPPLDPSLRMAFQKLRLWEGDFSVASATVAARVDGQGVWRGVRLCLGGVAPVPWRAYRVERELEGRKVSAAQLRLALDKALDAAAHPLARNGWKLDAAGGLAETAAERING